MYGEEINEWKVFEWKVEKGKMCELNVSKVNEWKKVYNWKV